MFSSFKESLRKLSSQRLLSSLGHRSLITSPGPRAQASPAKGTGGSGNENESQVKHK